MYGYAKVSHKYKKISYKYERLKNIIIKGSAKVYSMHFIKLLFIFNLETI